MKKIYFLSLLCLAASLQAQTTDVKTLLSQKRLVIIMFDGFGMSYYKNAPMPFLKEMAAKGFFKQVDALMPTVTNANNAAICCSAYPEKTGITGNSFLANNGEEEYMESKDLLLSPTIFERLKQYGIRSALVASKRKSIGLLSQGTDIAVSPETADTSWTKRLGKPAPIYSAEVNFWSMTAALDILKEQPDVRCVYIHTTDYPMHTWAPEDSNSIRHLAKMDEYIRKITEIAPDAIVMITADHDVNHKARCVDLEKALAKKDIKIKIAISAERDKYLKHHRGFGGTSFVYLDNAADEAKVKKALLGIKGVKTVMSRQEAAKKYHLMPERIGNLLVFSDSLSVFGNLENAAEEDLPATYRTHGSEYEIKVPLLIYNAPKLPPADFFKHNMDLAAWLFKEK